MLAHEQLLARKTPLIPNPSFGTPRTINAMSGPGQRFYEEDEAEQILNLAASMSSPLGQMSHERLLDTAAELGISAEAVEAAEKQVSAQRLDQRLRAEFDSIQRREFYTHLTPYVLFNGFFVLLCLNHHLWAIWPILGWGIGLAFHARATFFRVGSEYQDRFETWKQARLRQSSDSSDSIEKQTGSPGLVIGVHIGSGKDSRRAHRREERIESRDRL